MFNCARRHAPIEAFLQIAVEQAVNQPRREGIAGAKTIHNFHLVSARLENAALLIGDGGPGVLPDQRIFADRDGDGPERKAPRQLYGRILMVLARNAEDFFGVLLRGDEYVAVLHQVGHAAVRFGLTPELYAVIEIDAGGDVGGLGGL